MMNHRSFLKRKNEGCLPIMKALIWSLLTFSLGNTSSFASESDSAYFESKVLPLLQERCFKCHSHENKIKGGLALDSRSGWVEGGDTGPAIKPGEVEESLLIKAVRYVDADFEMPPKGKLSADEIATLEKWVKSGAPDPRVGESVASKPERVIDLEEGKKFWAFQSVAKPSLPQVNDPSWPFDPLDHFILSKLEEKGIKPVSDADAYTWLRRVSLDLTGLPPTADEVVSFANDHSPKAYEKAVDRLLNSKAYGERWARHWLDLTGYADMVGTSNSVFTQHAWRYRDYLIKAFNKDLPFDEFIKEQIAGDLMSSTSIKDRASKITATGFLLVGDIEIVNPDKAKMEADLIDTQMIKIGTAFMGMTLGCVRCHDHKFDPIGLEDYYGIAGMLRSSPSTHKIPFGVWSMPNDSELPETPEQLAARKKLEAEEEKKIAAFKAEQTKLTAEKKSVTKELEKTGKTKAVASVLTIDTANSERVVAAAKTVKADIDRDALTKRRDDIDRKLKKLGSQIQHAEFFKSKVPKALAMSDGDKPEDMPVYIRGNPYTPGSVIPRGVMRVASWDKMPAIPEEQSGRLQLAEWLADKRHPLTARVTVNRIWQKLFGEGIVSSVDYFGTRGELPTHPELLDHLATRFVRNGWSQKQFLRSLVLSHTYRMSSANDDAAMKLDPENKLLWRMNRQRLEAEALRDSLLLVSGELTHESGGPALVLEKVENTGSLVKKGVNPPNYSHRSPRPSQEFERTIYLPVMRNGLTSADKIRGFFDFIDPATIAGQRNQTVVATQSLFLLNNELVRKRAKAIADELIESHASDSVRLNALWLRVLNRPISSIERKDAIAFLSGIESLITTENNKPAPDALKWQELCHSLLASNEFIYRL